MSENTWETLAVQAKFCPHALATLCSVSLRTLQRRFDRTYGMPVGHWMRQLRLARAYNRIASGETVKSVAYDLHFKQLSHFSRVFKEAYGVAPTLISPRGAAKAAEITRRDPLGITPPAILPQLLGAESRVNGAELHTHPN
jgi:AraC-like DNA-binding protein